MANILYRAYQTYIDQGLWSLLYRSVIFTMGLILLQIANLFPTNKSIIIFGARHGTEYKDNPRYVYEYLLKNRDYLNPVWMTRNSDVYNRLSSEGLPVTKINSLYSYYLLLRANIAVYTHGPNDVSAMGRLPKEMKILRLGHGRPVKYDEEYIRRNNLEKRRQKKIDRVDKITSNSEFMFNSFPKNPEWPSEMVEIVGKPRNDILIDIPDTAKKEWNSYCNQFDFEISTTILYAPTVRKPKRNEKATTTDFFPFEDFDESELGDFLQEFNALLLIRPHPWDLDQIQSESNKYETIHDYSSVSELFDLLTNNTRICIADETTFPDTNQLLPFVDILVTDYSSIYHDFLLLDRPILFVPYDFEAFKNDYGFIYDYLNHLPGPRISSFDEFVCELDIAVNNINKYQSDRIKLRNKIHKHQDGRSTKRTAELIDEMV